MSAIQDITQRITDSLSKRDRLNSTLMRHNAALEKKQRDFIAKHGIDPKQITQESTIGNDKAYWDMAAIKLKESDIESVQKKIAEVDVRIEKLKAQLRTAEAQEAFIKDDIPQVIKDFFAKWKQESISFFSNRYGEYQELSQQLRSEEYAARREAVRTLPEYAKYLERLDRMSDYDLLNVFPRKPMEEYLKSRNLDHHSISERKSSFAGPVVSAMCRYNDPEQRRLFLEHTMEQEMNTRMLDLAQRIGKCVGRITDAAGLHIQNGEIAGVIFGEIGSASIQTIGAGGYNIQRYHFRTLVHPLEQYETQAEQPESEEDGEEMEL